MFFSGIIYAFIVGSIYLFIRGWQSLEILGRKRVWFAVAFWFVFLIFLAAHILRRRGISSELFEVSFYIGYYTCVILTLYGFLMLLAIDIFRIIVWTIRIKPDFIYCNLPLNKAIMFGIVCIALSVVLSWGYYNAHFPRTTYVEVSVDKKAEQLTELRVVMVCDIHLGRIQGRKLLARIVDTINKQQPDVILLIGDIFDGSPIPVIEKNMGIEFDRLQTKYGVYMIASNHERIGRREERNEANENLTIAYMASHGVETLLDTVILIENSFYLAGRKDYSDHTRKTIPELLSNADRRIPIILADHQPYNLDEAELAGVDLQLSGHTHHGQLFPLNYITRSIYEKDWGFLQKGKTHFYISCGVGTWGPPFRTAGYSEVVVVDIKLSQ